MKYCSHCGKPALDDDKFCMTCGTAFTAMRSDTQAAPHLPDDGDKVSPPEEPTEPPNQTTDNKVTNTTESSPPIPKTSETPSSQVPTPTPSLSPKSSQPKRSSWKEKGGCAGCFIRLCLILVVLGAIGIGIGVLSKNEVVLSTVDQVSSAISKIIAGNVTPEFKEYMDGYERFVDDYIAFMETYKESNDVAGMLNDYVDMMSRYAEAMSALNDIDVGSLSSADEDYYFEVMKRINKKLANLSSE